MTEKKGMNVGILDIKNSLDKTKIQGKKEALSAAESEKLAKQIEAQKRAGINADNSHHLVGSENPDLEMVDSLLGEHDVHLHDEHLGELDSMTHDALVGEHNMSHDDVHEINGVPMEDERSRD